MTGEIGKDEVVYICPPTYVGLGASDRVEDINREVWTNANALISVEASALWAPNKAKNLYFTHLKDLSYRIDFARAAFRHLA